MAVYQALLRTAERQNAVSFEKALAFTRSAIAAAEEVPPSQNTFLSCSGSSCAMSVLVTSY